MQTDRNLSLNAALTVLVQEYTSFIPACYRYTQCENMATSLKMWKNRVRTSSKSVAKVSSLPPTTESFVQNVKRAHLYVCI